MPSTIPYDPALVIGNLVHPDDLKNLEAIGNALAPGDAAEDKLNNLITLKRSIDMTIQELIDMKIEPKKLQTKSVEIGKKIIAAAEEYGDKKMKAEEEVIKLKEKEGGIVSHDVESPIDYNRTGIKYMPLSADSMRLNAQYFHNEENEEDSETHANTVKSFVSSSVSWLGDSFSAQASGAAQDQVNDQTSRHEISGTLVVTVSCTHKNALLLAPFILDVDKAIRVWNQVCKKDDTLKPDDVSSLMKISKQDSTEKDKKTPMQLISGATFGSCFIGMVHIVNTTNTKASEKMESVAASLQSQFKVGGWFADVSGGFGVDSSFSSDAKSLLSSQNVQSHCTLTTVGAIPSIKSSDVKLAVAKFTEFDGAKSAAKLQALQNANASENQSVATAAQSARTGAQMEAMKTTEIKAVLTGLSETDSKNDKVLDITSLMTAMEDYVNRVQQDNFQGVPINYYLKPITKGQLAQMWVAKYFPGKYLAVAGDDSEKKEKDEKE